MNLNEWQNKNENVYVDLENSSRFISATTDCDTRTHTTINQYSSSSLDILQLHSASFTRRSKCQDRNQRNAIKCCEYAKTHICMPPWSFNIGWIRWAGDHVNDIIFAMSMWNHRMNRSFRKQKCVHSYMWTKKCVQMSKKTKSSCFFCIQEKKSYMKNWKYRRRCSTTVDATIMHSWSEYLSVNCEWKIRLLQRKKKKKNRAKSRSLQIKKIYWIEERNANPEQNNNKEKYVKRVHADINRSFPLRVQRVHVISSWSRSPSNVAHPSVSRFLHGLTIVDYVRVHVLYVWITHVKWCTSTRLSAVSILFFCFSLYVRFI